MQVPCSQIFLLPKIQVSQTSAFEEIAISIQLLTIFLKNLLFTCKIIIVSPIFFPRSLSTKNLHLNSFATGEHSYFLLKQSYFTLIYQRLSCQPPLGDNRLDCKILTGSASLLYVNNHKGGHPLKICAQCSKYCSLKHLKVVFAFRKCRNCFLLYLQLFLFHSFSGN